MWRRTVMLGIAALGLLAGCGPDAALDGLADGGAARVVSVAAGGTASLQDGRRIALAGVVLPAPGEPYAGEARSALAAMTVGREVRLLYGGPAEGPFHLRDVRRRDWLQQRLLEQGAARVRTGFDDRALARELLRSEARARQAERGLWALPAYQVRLPGEVVAARATGFQLVEGRVARAAEAGGRLFLEFGREWRGGFSTETPLEALPRFEAAGLDLRGLQGRLVRVRGEVRATAFGPRLRLDHPEQVERLRDPAPSGR
jgi:endonuclease YncB( thermonuclease family)